MTAAIEVASKAAVKIVVNAVSGGSSGGVTAHGSLTGLTTGDDHTQYQRSESVFTAAASYTITSETTIVSTGSTVVLPSAQAKAGRSVLVGAGANLTVNTSGTDTFIDGSGATTFAIQSGNGVGFTAINVTGVGWGWAIVTRQGSSYDLPVWVGQSLAAGKVLRIDGTGAPAWASIAAGDLPAATTSAAGSMSAADKTKLDGVATGATANSSDATLLARANHTGTQAAGTITGLATIATSGSATDLSTGTVPSARLSTKAVGGQGAGSTVTEPTTATSLLTSTVTIPACAAGDTLIIDAGINFTQSATSKTYTFAIKLGATTMLSVQPTVSLSATARVAHIHAVVRVLTTTSQAGAMTIVFNTNTSAATAIPYAATGTATETISSGSLALDILATTSASGSTQTLNLAFLSVNKVAA
jgi:hypothetical protein